MNGREALAAVAAVAILAGCGAARPAPPAAPATAAVPPTTIGPALKVSAAGGCPAGVASQLARTGPARQLVTVVAAGWVTTAATLELWQRSGACWEPAGGPWPAVIGENGFSDHHVEGDGTTPTGMYGLGPVIYGNAPDPGVREPYHRLVCGDWWDEDPGSPAYNTFQHVPCDSQPPFGGGSEALWKETVPYPSFAVIDYNIPAVAKGAGSAIFLHADTGSPTNGCVSIPLAQLDQVLRWLDPRQAPEFVMGPAGEIDRF
ncbi:MAG TPA: L,D-transpeptidase family protein [Acidimicrobiales bacterium]|nr:L,D-transpeptidase family protein [Acidimicrobiales bacterium]